MTRFVIWLDPSTEEQNEILVGKDASGNCIKSIVGKIICLKGLALVYLVRRKQFT